MIPKPECRHRNCSRINSVWKTSRRGRLNCRKRRPQRLFLLCSPAVPLPIRWRSRFLRHSLHEGKNLYSHQYFQNGAYTKSFNNEYIDEFVQEAKKYNIEQGNAFSANTDLDILRNLKGERPQAPSKPYPDEDQPVTIKPISQNMNPEPARKPQTVSAPLPKDNDTADISFTGKPSKKAKSWDEDIFDDTGEFTDEDEYIDDDPRTMTKDDIAAEVRRMIDNQPKQDAGSSSRAYARKTVKENSNDDYYNRPTTERILNETSMIRSQMDDYEDNLNDVNDKMHRTNQILNIVLIILIIALALVLAVVVYWVLLSKGVIS